MHVHASARASRGTDKIDARILSRLQRDGRISNLKLAEEVHLSPTAVLERVKRLTREGYILGYEARLNADKLGIGLVTFVEVRLDRAGADVMARFKTAVQARPEILECHLMAGSFDYLLKLRTGDAHAQRDFIAGVIEMLPGVREARSYTVTEQVKQCRGSEPPIDGIDAQLLRMLQADGRITITRLAEAVGLSAAATHDRVSRLKREGYILGYEAVLNPAMLNTGLLVWATVSVVEPKVGTGRVFKAAVQVCNEVLECHEVEGSFDYLVKVRVPDIHAFRQLVAPVAWRLPGVREVRTYAVIEEVKSTARIPL